MCVCVCVVFPVTVLLRVVFWGGATRRGGAWGWVTADLAIGRHHWILMLVSPDSANGFPSCILMPVFLCVCAYIFLYSRQCVSTSSVGTFSGLRIGEVQSVGELSRPEFIIHPHRYFNRRANTSPIFTPLPANTEGTHLIGVKRKKQKYQYKVWLISSFNKIIYSFEIIQVCCFVSDYLQDVIPTLCPPAVVKAAFDERSLFPKELLDEEDRPSHGARKQGSREVRINDRGRGRKDRWGRLTVVSENRRVWPSRTDLNWSVVVFFTIDKERVVPLELSLEPSSEDVIYIVIYFIMF